MDELIPGERASRDFRVKFPDDVIQDNLAGQLWFGAEVIMILYMSLLPRIIMTYERRSMYIFDKKKTVSHNAIAFRKICSLLLLSGLKKMFIIFQCRVRPQTAHINRLSVFTGIHRCQYNN